MKKILLLFCSFYYALAFAQQAPPQGINYQAMVYAPYGNQQTGVNNAGQLPANTKQAVVKFTLEEGQNGPVIYEETHIDTTDQYGLLSTVIGTGTPTSSSPGLFNQIDWSMGDPYLRVSITLTQYSSTVTSYQKLWSVPYALYADQANSANTSDYATNSGHADSSDYADLAGNGITGVTDNGNGTLTFTYLDGSTYTTPVLMGLMGAPGPQGPAGQNGSNGQSAYDIWLSQGNTGTQQDFLNSLQGVQGPAGQNGTNGQSAYDIWLAQGNTGTIVDFLNSLMGPQGLTGPQGPSGVTGSPGPTGSNGQSAYDIWIAQGNTGTVQDFLNSLTGPQGPNGANGINGLNGLSAYQIWLSLGNTGTEQDFLNSLTGPQGPAGNSLSNGTVNNQMLYWNGTSWVNLNPGINGQVLTLCNGVLTWTTGGTCPGSISTINCLSATNSGTLSVGIVASGVTSSVPYTGGNGGSYSAQNINSTGVTGLIASITAGTFNNGPGSLSYTITGTPSTGGTASFVLNIGSQSCILSLTVSSSLVSQFPVGSVFCASGPTEIVDVINPTTGKTWMDRNLGASQVASGSTDANSYGDLYQWGRGSDGHQCRNSSSITATSSIDQPGHDNFIFSSNYDWRIPENLNLWQGLNGINNPCPSGYRIPTLVEWDAERLSWITPNTNGAITSPLKLTLSGRRYSSGSIQEVTYFGRYWSSTVYPNVSYVSYELYFQNNAAGSSNSPRYYAQSVRCIKEENIIQGSINTIDCGTITNSGTLTSGTVVSNISSSVPYTGGNGGIHNGQTVGSTGVTGLTATLFAGTFANGNGILNYVISGTPNSSGTANFALTIGGQSCTLLFTVESNLVSQYPVGSVFCTSGPTAIVDVTNPITGKTWMDRNLGASQVATSSTDINSYGDLYQWGRGNDGHQCRNSLTTATLSSANQPGHGDFILSFGVNTSPYTDWLNPQNGNLWQIPIEENNPCPIGYRLPSDFELDAERLSWASNNINGAFNSLLKFTLSGRRDGTNGTLVEGTFGGYWSKTTYAYMSRYLIFNGSNSWINNSTRSYGFSVRCIKN
jgi:hypothetical protein